MLILFGVVLFTTAAFSPLHAAPPAEDGFYVYLRHPSLKNWDDVYETALAADYVDGAAIVIEWNVLEPKRDDFNWSLLDRWIKKVVMLHKKFAIGVTAGFFTPEWVYEIGAPRNTFNFNRNPRGVACSVISVPSPWHPIFLREYSKMIATLARHLQEMSIPGRNSGAVYEALSVVKIGGINVSTDELRLPANEPDDGPCKQSDATAVWLDAGFRPDKILSAWMTIADKTAQAFPGKTLSVAAIHRRAFPAIDDAGHVYKPNRDADAVTIRILDAAVDKFGGRLMVQWNALWQRGAPKEVLDAGRKGAKIGWQMNSFLGVYGGSGCIYKPFKIRACESVDDFQAILDNGIDKGGQYIEIHAPSANSTNASAFENAHKRLR